MRFVVPSLSAVLVLMLVACKGEEEAPNPPSNPNGNETPAQSDGNASLPGSSDPEVGKEQPKTPPAAENTSSSSSGGTPPVLPNGPTSGVDQDKKLNELSSADKKLLCDWQAGINGGYGKSTTCGGTTISSPKTQSACVSKLPSCAATVAEVEACLKVDAADPCAFALFKAPECEPVRSCQ